MVTGASSGIGLACARLFAERGCRLALTARRADRLEVLAAEIRDAGGEAAVFPGDLVLKEVPERLAREVVAHYGRIDVLVNNAGFGRLDFLERLDPETDINAQLQVDLLAAISLTRQVLPAMLKQGSGGIINICSIASFIPTPMYSIYSAGKFGMRGFTDALRRELRSQGISVTGVYPGFVNTEFIEHIGRLASQGSRTPRFLWLTAEQVARQVVDATSRPRRAIFIPWYFRIAVVGEAILPGVVDWFLERYLARRVKQALED